MALAESEVHTLLEQVQAEFGNRHLKVSDFLMLQFDQLQHLFEGREISAERKLLLGAYFTHEYSLEGAALFNPSMVPHPDKSGVPPGSLRFVLSLRATAEGHISSVTFRTGMLDANNNIVIDSPTRYSLEPLQVRNALYDKPLFERKLHELGLSGDFNRQVLERLGATFTYKELSVSVSLSVKEPCRPDHEAKMLAKETLILAASNYEVQFAPDSCLSERVLFPATPSQSNGIEDARFVLFDNENGTKTYYATYTAYDGKMILPQFGRQDAENIYIMFSDHLHFWHTTQLLLEPTSPWEFIQLGNCGSPIETPAGWLVISHGVGPMRKYCIGAFLLDRDDPTKVVRRLREPLITPDENEREGYVPNVVYSCGSLVHGKDLIVPYGMSDSATMFAILPLNELIAAME